MAMRFVRSDTAFYSARRGSGFENTSLDIYAVLEPGECRGVGRAAFPVQGGAVMTADTPRFGYYGESDRAPHWAK